MPLIKFLINARVAIGWSLKSWRCACRAALFLIRLGCYKYVADGSSARFSSLCLSYVLCHCDLRCTTHLPIASNPRRLQTLMYVLSGTSHFLTAHVGLILMAGYVSKHYYLKATLANILLFHPFLNYTRLCIVGKWSKCVFFDRTFMVVFVIKTPLLTLLLRRATFSHELTLVFVPA